MLYLLPSARAVDAAPVQLTVDVDHPGIAISPRLYGIFFEDINRSGDGGLCAEMLQNRSFEDFDLPLGWTELKENSNSLKISLDSSKPLNDKNPTSLRLDISSLSKGRVGVYNQGYKGIPLPSKDPVHLLAGKSTSGNPLIEPRWQPWLTHFYQVQERTDNGLVITKDSDYRCSLYARTDGSFSGPITVSLERQDGTVLASHDFPGISKEWSQYQIKLKPMDDESNARFVISFKTPGAVWLDMVSLFPVDTFNHRPNGLRPDLMKMLVDLHPAFVRFPAGSFGEGHRLDEAFRWKETIGDPAQRPGVWNIWGYRSTNGLGYFEYLQMCEDLHAEPLFVINCGISETNMADLKDLNPWIQDAVDCVEYANGSETSPWGSLRAQAGHPAPFNLKMLEIGNENGMSYPWGGGNAQQYAERYNPIYNKLKEIYPNLQTISTAPIQKAPISAPVEMVDEHYYPNSQWFDDHSTMYDSYDRKGPKIYVGEYATKQDAGNGNMRAALGEAAFMIGMERNSDVVQMASYAPLFVNPSWQKWNPNLIVFNPSTAYGTPSYYNQMLFAINRPDVILPTQIQSQFQPSGHTPLFQIAGRRQSTGEIILKVVNVSGESIPALVTLKSTALGGKVLHASVTVLTAANPQDENSFKEPTKISPKKKDIGPVLNQQINCTFPAYSVNIITME